MDILPITCDKCGYSLDTITEEQEVVYKWNREKGIYEPKFKIVTYTCPNCHTYITPKSKINKYI